MNFHFMMLQILVAKCLNFGIFNPKSPKFGLTVFCQQFSAYFVLSFFPRFFFSLLFKFIFNLPIRSPFSGIFVPIILLIKVQNKNVYVKLLLHVLACIMPFVCKVMMIAFYISRFSINNFLECFNPLLLLKLYWRIQSICNK